MATQQPAERAESFADLFGAVADNIARVIQGKPDVIELVLLCLISEGHLLVEDVPGVGKTSLAKALATSIDCTFGRMQFTPDLLPSDVVGVSVWDRSTSRFDFRPGPGVLQHRARRRDQPGLAQDAVRAARGDGRAAGDRRWRHLPAPAAVHGHRDAEPDRARGDVSRSPRASSTGSSCGCRSAIRAATPRSPSSTPTAATMRSSASDPC